MSGPRRPAEFTTKMGKNGSCKFSVAFLVFLTITLVKYVGNKKAIRREVGSTVWCSCLISTNNQKFIMNIMAQKYCGNEGMVISEGVDFILEVVPQLSRIQAPQSCLQTA
jgi:hypothetical protein